MNRAHNVTIKLTTIDDIRHFVEMTTLYDGDIDIRSDRYVVDAKSILGILSLDLKGPLLLDVYGDEADRFIESIAKYHV